MRRTTVITGFVAAVVGGMLLLPGPARAQDRSDLLDVPFESFLVPGPTSNAAHDYVFVALDEVPPLSSSMAKRRESFSVVHEFPGVDNISLRIYEPDKVSRSATGFSLSQKDQLFFRVLLAVPPAPYSSNTFSAYGVVSGCKGQAATSNSGTTFKWSYSCKSADDVLNQLSVPPGLKTYIIGLFGSKFKVKGQGGPP